jgi:hypothetical protein
MYMDDQNQIPNPNTQVPTAPVPPQPPPVGGLNKEAGPVAEMPVVEVLQPSEKSTGTFT